MRSAWLPLILGTALAASGQTPCDKLAQLKLTGGTVTGAESVPAGPFQNPAGSGNPLQVPAFCRVTATLRPVPDSSIDIEVWMPDQWNGKYEAVGNGGWGGVISYPAMASALAEGYATSSTDTGHKGGNASFAPGHPEKLVDFSYRAVHEMTVAAKTVVQARFGKAPKQSYWNGCSYGGRQALEEARRYPADYDGILAGAPANYHTHLHAFDMKVAQVMLKDEAHQLTAAQLGVLHAAVVAECDALDGVKDGLVSNPRACRFNPATLLCKGANTAACLTAPQLESVQAMYDPARRKDGTILYPGLPFGGELGWIRPAPVAPALDTYRYVLHEDAAWDWHNFDIDKDVRAVDEKAPYLNATNPDLKAFRDRGGKLLMYHGWSDQLISAENSINFRASVENALGGSQASWLRLFLVPGMQHCRGGDGPTQFNGMAALERWVEAKEAPDQIPAAHATNNTVDRTRPLCPYPQVAVYKGTGSTNDAGNFACRAR